jgi:Xaa-Pro aminopeptidase
MTNLRLEGVRAAFAALGVDAFIVPRADEHLGEYVPPSAARLAWLTGFTGSAGIAVVTAHEAAVFTDGRYILQVAAQTDPGAFQTLHIIEQPPPAWLATRARRVGYDPWLISEAGLQPYAEAGLEMVPLSPNPIDTLWTDRPPAPAQPAEPHPDAVSGRSAADKIAALASTLQAAGQAACVLTDPASVDWLLNIRGGDIPFAPLALGYAVLHAEGRVDLYMNPAKLPPATRAWLGNAVTCHPPVALGTGLAAFARRRVRVDPAGAPVAVAQALRAFGAVVSPGTDPCLLPKACKNAVEQQGARNAQARDAVALCRFLHWLSEASGETEMSAAAHLLALREEVDGFRGESFPAISGAGEHGAIIHYRVTPETDRAIGPNEVYLIDSGGQYPDGTTDVTRTIWTGPSQPPAELRDRFTRVLQGNIALATTVFPQGVAGPHLDAVARRPLWSVGLDYDHGTGHGVGSFMSVHEGPVSLSRVAKPVPIGVGMILSNEPGFYAPGEYGIRLETLLMVQPADLPGPKPFLRFEVLTLAPFDRTLIDPAMLTGAERAWLDAYHARVAAEIGPKLTGAARKWLLDACRAIE